MKGAGSLASLYLEIEEMERPRAIGVGGGSGVGEPGVESLHSTLKKAFGRAGRELHVKSVGKMTKVGGEC